MKNADIKALSEEELRDQIKSEHERLVKLKFSHAVSPIENPHRIRASRKLVARLKTELRAKELAKS